MSVQQVVPFLCVSSMERSVGYYVKGLGFAIKHEWVVGGRLRWCWLARDGAALMLQEVAGRMVGDGMSLYFICDDAVAIYRQLRSRGIEASEPQVGNHMWVTTLTDPDGYRLHFESLTDVPEETKLSEIQG